MLPFHSTANETVPGCAAKNLKEDDIHGDEDFERLLMCNIFHSCRCDLPILKQTSFSATKGYKPSITVLCSVTCYSSKLWMYSCIRKLNFPVDVTWRTFSDCNSQLSVKLSDLDSSKKTCLAYYKKNG